jgi:HK97 gp10 family phage protein
MAKSVTVSVDGLRDLGERMKALSEDMNKKIGRAGVAAGAGLIARAAKVKAPVDTGNLRKNIITKRIPPGESALTSEYIVTVRQGKLTQKQRAKGLQDAFYGRFVEHGTAKMPAKPFLRPAYDENKEKAVEAIKERIAARLTKAGA